jgi:hypothetical protein
MEEILIYKRDKGKTTELIVAGVLFMGPLILIAIAGIVVNSGQ